MSPSRCIFLCLLFTGCSNTAPGDARDAGARVDTSERVDAGVDGNAGKGAQASADGGGCAKLATSLSSCAWYDTTRADALSGCDKGTASCILGLTDVCDVEDVLNCAYQGSDPDFAAVCLGDTAIWSDGADSAAFGCGSHGSCRTCTMFGAVVSGCSDCGGALPGSMTCNGNVFNWCAGCEDKSTILTSIDCSIDGTTCVTGEGCVKP